MNSGSTTPLRSMPGASAQLFWMCSSTLISRRGYLDRRRPLSPREGLAAGEARRRSSRDVQDAAWRRYSGTRGPARREFSETRGPVRVQGPGRVVRDLVNESRLYVLESAESHFGVEFKL